MIVPRLPVTFAAAAAILAACSVTIAQTDGGGSSFGSGGGFGQSSFGSSALRPSSFDSGGFGTTGQGGSSFGSAFGQSGSASQNNGEPAFVGRNAADVLNAFGQAFGQASSGRSGRSRSGRSEANPSTQRRPPVSVPLTLDPALERAASQLDPGSIRAMRNAARLMSRKGLNGVRVSGAGGDLRLDGAVTSEAERLLAEKLLAIEPGIRQVENLLQVVPQAAEALPAPR